MGFFVCGVFVSFSLFPLDVTVDKQLVSRFHFRNKQFSYGGSVTSEGVMWIRHILGQLEQHRWHMLVN